MASSNRDDETGSADPMSSLLRKLAAAPAVDPEPRVAERLQPGSRIDAYEILEHLGDGGMGSVYRARDAGLGRDVALKLLRPGSTGRELLARFRKEARALAAVSHPNIVAIHHVGEMDDGALYLVLEYLRGETVRTLLRRGPIEAPRAVAYALAALDGLAAAHERGIVHRDIKPENLFVTAEDSVKVLDFGLAKTLAPGASSTASTNAFETEAGTVLGTVHYMAPEQIRCESVDERTDLFALGAVLYEMLSGWRPFQEPTAPETMNAILRSHPPPLNELLPQLGTGLAGFVERCLIKDRQRRFASAAEAADALRRAATNPGEPLVRSRPEIRYARSGNLHIAYQVSGQGPDLLCVPGFVANSETLWEEPQTARFLEHLNAGARLTLFDKRGTGHSDAHVGERPPSLNDLAADALAVADAAGARRPVVWGVSEGVSVAVRLAATWPDRVAGLVLYAGFALGIPSELPEELRIVVERWGSGRTLEVFAPTAARDPAKRQWWARWERNSASPGAALQHMASIAGIDVRADLPGLRMPVLVMHRIGDRAVNVASSRYIAKKIPGAQLIEYEGDDHLPSFGPPGGPERLADDILRFCRRIAES